MLGVQIRLDQIRLDHIDQIRLAVSQQFNNLTIKLRMRRCSQISCLFEHQRLSCNVTVRLNQTRLDWTGLDWIRLDQIRLDQIRLDQIRLDQIRLDQIRLDQITGSSMCSTVSSILRPLTAQSPTILTISDPKRMGDFWPIQLCGRFQDNPHCNPRLTSHSTSPTILSTPL